MKTEINLVYGCQYLVKHFGGKKFVRRIYKGDEMRFDKIKCLVFSSSVNANAYALIEFLSGGRKQITYKNTNKIPISEISIPFYDVIEIKNCKA